MTGKDINRVVFSDCLLLEVQRDLIFQSPQISRVYLYNFNVFLCHSLSLLYLTSYIDSYPPTWYCYFDVSSRDY